MKKIPESGPGSFRFWFNKSPRRESILNRIHKGFVTICIVVSVVGFAEVSTRGYRIYSKAKNQPPKTSIEASPEPVTHPSEAQPSSSEDIIDLSNK